MIMYFRFVFYFGEAVVVGDVADGIMFDVVILFGN